MRIHRADRHVLGTLVIAALAPLLLAAAPPPAGPVGDPPVRFPDVALLEPQAAQQIGEAQRRLTDLLGGPGASQDPAHVAKIAAAYGELGKLYHAYHLAAPAEDCYRNAMRLAPQGFRWPHYLGLLLHDAGRLDEAAAAYARALELEPKDVPALLYLAEVSRLRGRAEEAEAALRRALAIDPASTAARALLGQTALDRRDFAEAVRLLEAVLAEVPEANRLHYPLAMAYRALGNPDKAGEHLALAGQVGIRPEDPLREELAGLRTGEQFRLMRGHTAFRASRFADAAEEFRLALALRPESVEARINLAAALSELGKPSEAVTHLREAVRLDPGNANARFNLGVLLASAGPSPEAAEHLAAVVAARPQDGEARRTLGRVLRGLGRLEEALARYRQAVQLDPADEAARLGEADSLVQLGRYGPARERLEEGLRALPQSGLLTHGLARLLAACPDLSIRDGARALELAVAVHRAQPAVPHAETAAMALAELGRCADAARWQRAALEEAELAGQTGRKAELAAALALYERGAPCRFGVAPPAKP